MVDLLKLHDPALKLRDQFVAAVYLGDHLAYPGVGVGKLALQFGFGSGHGGGSPVTPFGDRRLPADDGRDCRGVAALGSADRSSAFTRSLMFSANAMIRSVNRRV